MSTKPATTNETSEPKRARKPRGAKTTTPLDLAAHVHAVTAQWSDVDKAIYERVLAALRGA